MKVYQEQAAIKMEEEKELVKVFNDYKKKHDEFSKAMKKSKDTFKVYEQEIKNMNARIQDLLKTKKTIQGKKKQTAAASQAKEKELEEVAARWNEEKEKMTQEREMLKQMCSEIQEQIKAVKDGKGQATVDVNVKWVCVVCRKEE